MLTARYLRANYILVKIARNELAARVDEWDVGDKIRYEIVISEYETTVLRKTSDLQKNSNPQNLPTSKRNRSQDLSGHAAKKIKNSSTQGVEGPTTSVAVVAARVIYSESGIISK